jgi:hypothetical protein
VKFGTWLERVFDPASSAEFGYRRKTTLHGVPVDVFTYRVSRDHGYTLQSGPPLQEGAVLRIRMECTGIPAGFPVEIREQTTRGVTRKAADYRSYRKFEMAPVEP